MNESKHTRLPWTIEENGYKRTILGGHYHDKEGRTATVVAVVEGNQTSQVVTQANAELIVNHAAELARVTAERDAAVADNAALLGLMERHGVPDILSNPHPGASLLAERAALAASIAKLPKTVDAVPVTPGMILYRRQGVARVMRVGEHGCEMALPGEPTWAAMYCYSSELAMVSADAAALKGTP